MSSLADTSIRHLWVDSTRGMAILLMILANMFHLLLVPPGLEWRWVGSLAAPLFVMLSGMMVWHTRRVRGRSFRYICKRALQVLAVGVAVDALIWNIVPFMTMDVLYLIPLGMLLAATVVRVPPFALLMLAVALVAAGELGRLWLGYRDYPAEILLLDALQNGFSSYNISAGDLARHWLLEGWFPALPWLAYSVLGVALAHMLLPPVISRQIAQKGWNLPLLRWLMTAAVAVLLLGLLMEAEFPSEQLIRMGYMEVFYPPTWTFVMISAAIAVMLVIFRSQMAALYHAASQEKDRRFPRLITVCLRASHGVLCGLGKHPLVSYVLHLAVLAYVLEPCCAELSLPGFVGLYLALVAGICAAITLLRVCVPARV